MVELLIVGGITITVITAVAVYFFTKYKDLEQDSLTDKGVIDIQSEQLRQEQTKYRRLLSQKKSSETRLGQISEHLVPFLKDCPYDPKQMTFLGNPLDYVIFDIDEGKITFLEVKSGNSRASKKQKTLKNIIEAGHVYYEELRINERGVKIKGSKK